MTFKVYLSSTLKDFEEERKAIKQALLPHCEVLESYDAAETSVRDKCIADVERSDLYVLLVGLRYGYRPTNEIDNPLKLSITELEYQATFGAGVPRLVYLKNNADEPFIDALTKENDPKLIANFRKRVSEGNDQTPFPFKTVEQLREAVFKAVIERKAQHERDEALMAAGFGVSHVAELRTDLVVVCAAGTDSKAKEAINAAGGARIRAVELSPDEPQYLLMLDRSVRTARAGGFLITKAALSRYNDATKRELISAALLGISRRCGRVFLFLSEVAAADVPADWQGQPGSVVVELGATDIVVNANEWLADAFLQAKARTPAIADDRRIGVPCLVIALVLKEAKELVDNALEVFKSFGDPEERNVRKNQLEDLKKAVKGLHADWPGGFYGAEVEDWRPFGPTGVTSRELVAAAFDRINADQSPASRGRRLLFDYSLHLQRYVFEDYRVDKFGSRAMMEEARDRGCLVLLDELTLLKPGLRECVDSFLSSQRVAIVSTNPCDPAHVPTSTLLGNLSQLRVGSLFERFRELQDPRCELSLNSPARLQRWLGFVLPELTTTLGQKESDPKLVAKSSELFAKK